MSRIRTDLALEAKESGEMRMGGSIPGILTDIEHVGDVDISRVRIISEIGEENIGKPKGTYITLDIKEAKNRDPEYAEDVSRLLSKEIRALFELKSKDTILVIGLGNWNITPDSLGPKVLNKLLVTRHIMKYMPTQTDERLRSVSAIAPGVLGITGIETVEIVKGVVEKLRPDFIIAIDALASQKTSRIGSSIQIADTGINPGSGIGNKRASLNEQTLGVKTIAVGVPTVVYASTIAKDSLKMLVDTLSEHVNSDGEFYRILKNMGDDQMDVLLDQVLFEGFGELVVTPKEVDMLIDYLSDIIADSLNMALHKDLTLEEVRRFLN